MLDIGLEIRILRERLKISAKELAEQVGLSQSQMSRLEKGQRRIDTRVLHQIASALKVEPSYFFGGSDAPPAGVIPPSSPKALGKLLRSQRRQRHVSAEELAAKVGRSKAVIQSVEEGKRPLDPELAAEMVKALRLPASFLLEAQQQIIRNLEGQVTRLNEALAEATRGDLRLGDGVAESRQGVPLLGTLADGYPREFDAAGRPLMEVEDFLYVPRVESSDAFALHAVGDSMESLASPSFAEGDLLVFAFLPLRSRDFAFVRLADETPVFRQVFFETKGNVRLQPLNLGYAAANRSRDEVLAMWRLVCHVRAS